MIFEVHFAVPCLDPPRILYLAPCNSLFRPRLAGDVQCLTRDDRLRNTNRSQTERVAQRVRGAPINLARDDTRAISQRLLESDGRRSPVVRRHVDVQPSQVHTRTSIDSDCAQEGGEEFRTVGHGREDDGVTDDADEISENEEGRAERKSVGQEGEREEAASAHDVHRDGEVLCL